MQAWKQLAVMGACVAGCGMAQAQGPTSFDESVELMRGHFTGPNSGSSGGFRVNSTTDPLLVSPGINWPELFLEVGKRYRFVNTISADEGLTLIGKGSGLDIAVILAQGPTVGSGEGLASVNWHEAGNTVYFTFSDELLALMSAGDRKPGYGSTAGGSEVILARGATSSGFTWTGDSTPRLETFESGALDDYIFAARADWFISSSAPLTNYTARITNVPAGRPGQAPGSTRWLRVTDSFQPINDTLNSVVTRAIVAPSGAIDGYTWEFLLNVETKFSGTSAYVGVEHLDASTGGYKRTWGLWIAANQVWMGLNESVASSAATGSPMGALMYNYTQSGFGTNQWVRVVMTADFATSSLSATVYPSNGGSPVTQTLVFPSDPFSANIAKGNFRFAVDNTAPGNDSTLCLDNLSLKTSATVLTAADQWEMYQ